MALLRHTVMLMEPGAAERRVRLRLVDPPADFADLQPSWDSEAIEQSLVNLLDNAIKHSPADDEVRVEVEATRRAHSGSGSWTTGPAFHPKSTTRFSISSIAMARSFAVKPKVRASA